MGETEKVRLNGHAGEIKQRSISARDFDDVFREYTLFQELGFPMHDTGMADHTMMIWNVSSPCAAALACVWANHLARYSMRTQVTAPSLMGLVKHITITTPFASSWANFDQLQIEPTGWSAWANCSSGNARRRLL